MPDTHCRKPGHHAVAIATLIKSLVPPFTKKNQSRSETNQTEIYAFDGGISVVVIAGYSGGTVTLLRMSGMPAILFISLVIHLSMLSRCRVVATQSCCEEFKRELLRAQSHLLRCLFLLLLPGKSRASLSVLGSAVT